MARNDDNNRPQGASERLALKLARVVRKTLPGLFRYEDGRRTPHSVEYWGSAKRNGGYLGVEAKGMMERERESDVIAGATGVMRPGWVRRVFGNPDERIPACEIDIKADPARHPEALRATLHHELVHCGLHELLGANGERNFLGHVAKHVPLVDLSYEWYGQFANAPGQTDDYGMKTWGPIRSGSYAEDYGLKLWEHMVDHGDGKGLYIDRSRKNEDGYWRVEKWTEEAFTALTTSRPVQSGPAEVPENPPHDSESMRTWSKAMARDIIAVYEGKLPREEFRERYAPIIEHEAEMRGTAQKGNTKDPEEQEKKNVEGSQAQRNAGQTRDETGQGQNGHRGKSEQRLHEIRAERATLDRELKALHKGAGRNGQAQRGDKVCTRGQAILRPKLHDESAQDKQHATHGRDTGMER